MVFIPSRRIVMKICVISGLILSFSSCYASDDIFGKTESLRRLLTETAVTLTSATQRLTEIDDTVRRGRLSQSSSRSDPSYLQSSRHTTSDSMTAPSVTTHTSVHPSYGVASSYASASTSLGSGFEVQEVTFGSGMLGFGGDKVPLLLKKKLERWDTPTTEHLVESNRNYHRDRIRLQEIGRQAVEDKKRLLEGLEAEKSRLSEELRMTNGQNRVLDQRISELAENLARKNDAYAIIESQLRDSREELSIVQRAMEEKKKEFEYSKVETSRYIADVEKKKEERESECVALRGKNTELKASLADEKRQMEDFKKVIEEARIRVQKQLDDSARKLKKKQEEMDFLEMQHAVELSQKSSEFQSKLEEYANRSESSMDDLTSRYSTAVRALTEYKEGVISILRSLSTLPPGLLEQIQALSTKN